jgi:hypothetical protein
MANLEHAAKRGPNHSSARDLPPMRRPDGVASGLSPNAGFSLFSVAAKSENRPLGRGREPARAWPVRAGSVGAAHFRPVADLRFLHFDGVAAVTIGRWWRVAAAEVVMPPHRIRGAALHPGPAGPRFGMHFLDWVPLLDCKRISALASSWCWPEKTRHAVP